MVQPSHCPRCVRHTLQIKRDLKTASVGDEVAGLVGLVVGAHKVASQHASCNVSRLPASLSNNRPCVCAGYKTRAATYIVIQMSSSNTAHYCPTQAQSKRVASDSYRLPCSAAGLGNKTRFLCRLAASATPLHDRVQKVSAFSVAVIKSATPLIFFCGRI